MSAAGAAATWLGLLALLGLEFAFAAIRGLAVIPPVIGLVMAVLVALFPMRLVHMRGTAAIFASAGVFWLGILLLTGSLDPFTRYDIPVPVRTQP